MLTPAEILELQERVDYSDVEPDVDEPAKSDDDRPAATRFEIKNPDDIRFAPVRVDQLQAFPRETGLIDDSNEELYKKTLRDAIDANAAMINATTIRSGTALDEYSNIVSNFVLQAAYLSIDWGELRRDIFSKQNIVDERIPAKLTKEQEDEHIANIEEYESSTFDKADRLGGLVLDLKEARDAEEKNRLRSEIMSTMDAITDDVEEIYAEGNLTENTAKALADKIRSHIIKPVGVAEPSAVKFEQKDTSDADYMAKYLSTISGKSYDASEIARTKGGTLYAVGFDGRIIHRKFKDFSEITAFFGSEKPIKGGNIIRYGGRDYFTVRLKAGSEPLY